MPDVKAIPTRWNGVTFRSRLEARWALFFTTLELDWVYEPEGFQTSGGWYLPDFYIPKLRLFFEAKPDRPLTTDEEHKIEGLADLVEDGQEVLVDYSGMTPFTEKSAIVYGPFEEEREQHKLYGTRHQPYLFCCCPACDKILVEPDGAFALGCNDSTAHDRLVPLGPNKIKHGPRVEAAYRIARKHRFDYGAHQDG